MTRASGDLGTDGLMRVGRINFRGRASAYILKVATHHCASISTTMRYNNLFHRRSTIVSRVGRAFWMYNMGECAASTALRLHGVLLAFYMMTGRLDWAYILKSISARNTLERLQSYPKTQPRLACSSDAYLCLIWTILSSRDGALRPSPLSCFDIHKIKRMQNSKFRLTLIPPTWLCMKSPED